MILSFSFICCGATVLYCGIAMVDRTQADYWIRYMLGVIGVATLGVGISRPILLHLQNRNSIQDASEKSIETELVTCVLPTSPDGV
jgi:HSP90 family molecular chaperone